MAHAYVDISLHCVFSTKNHDPMIDRELAPKLWRYIGGGRLDSSFETGENVRRQRGVDEQLRAHRG